ncbi:MAG: 30S ribosomal protein S9 [Elusimicrobiota bacterium]
MAHTMTEFWATGRRKSSVARVKLIPGNGSILVNRKTIENYFGGLSQIKNEILLPLELTKTLTKYDVRINVQGGGTTGQAGAIRHGIARALAGLDEANKTILKKQGLLTRDSRMVERKKPGRPKARKRFQFSKR